MSYTMTARRRNALDTTITVRITRPLAAMLKAEAIRRRMSVGSLVRLYTERGLASAGIAAGSSLKTRRIKKKRLAA